MGSFVFCSLEDLRELLREQCAAANDVERYYHRHTSPCGGRAFLAAAKALEFESFVMGRKIVARRSDVHAWIEREARKPKESVPQATVLDPEDVEFEKAMAPKRIRKG